MAIAGPRIDNVERLNGTWHNVTWAAQATGYTNVRAMVRRINASGTPIGGWAMANNAAAPPSPWLLTSIGGTPFTTDGYQIQFFATHTSGEPVDPSNIYTAPAWTVGKPTLASVVRGTGTSVTVHVQDMAVGGGSKLYLEARSLPNGSFGQVNAYDIDSASDTFQHFGLSASTDYEWRVRVGQYSVHSAYSNTRSTDRWTTPAPSLDTATRTLTGATIQYSGAVLTGNAQVRVQARREDGGWGNVLTFTPTSASGSRAVPLSSATSPYDLRVQQSQYGIWSSFSSPRSVGAWWLIPGAPVDLNVTRNATTGVVSGTWGAPSATAQTAVTGYRVYRAEDGQPKPTTAWLTRTASQRNFSDSTTDLAKSYRYWVESYNAAGPSSSAPSDVADAARERPNAASSLTATYIASGAPDRASMAWTTTPTVTRPVTSQKIVGRVPGTTTVTGLGTLAGNVTAHELVIGPNRIYELAIITSNSVGDAEATSNWSDPVVTTPAAPATVAARWRNSTDILVTWSDVFTVADVVDIDFATVAEPDVNNPAHWFPATGPSGVAVTAGQFPHEALSTVVPHTYRLRARHTASGRVSGWVVSNLVESQSNPMPPTLVMPVQVDATESITIRAQHNPVDNTDATAAQFRYRIQGSTTWITSPGTLTPFDLPRYVIAANTFTNGTPTVPRWLEVQGRTAGATGVYGDWGHVTAGASMLVPLRAKPVVTILSPAPGTHEAQTLTVEWEVDGVQASGTVILREDPPVGQPVVVDRIDVTGDVRSHTFTGLEDGKTYIVEVWVSDGWQKSDGVEVYNIDVVYFLPAPPTLTATVDLTDAQVLLAAAPRGALRTTRVNFMRSALEWWRDGGTVRASTATLTNPETGETTEAVHLPIPFPSRAYDTDESYQLASSWSLVQFVGEATRVSNTGSDGLDITLANQDFTPFSGGGTGTIFDVPVWPATKVGAHYLSPRNEFFRVRLQSAAVGDFYLLRSGIFGVVNGGTGEGDWLFDGSTTRDGYVYGRNSDGTSWEAVPDDAGDRDVADTVSIEILGSSTGLPGSFTHVGFTGSSWNYLDEHPPIGVPVWYIARAIAASGAYADSTPVRVVVDSCDAHISWGDRWQHKAHAGWEPSYTGTSGRRKAIRRAIGPDGEDRVGVVYGPKLQRVVNTRLTITPATGDTPLASWEEASEHKGHIVYRDPAGRVMVGPMDSFEWDDSDELAQTISFTVTRIRERP